ncbi:MAG: dinitrogenase iron-molybdenum cofactor biosynthesis protein [Dehalococcoidia bacterium]|nr:dinitrogenase iron-molybdenum cofactor biosynthesis protein [Dehalococcoidia bacterium]
MKIAVISEDGTTISQHFGRAPYYVVVTAEDGEVVDKEKRDKPGHHSFAHQHQEHDTHDERHGLGAKAQSRHASMAEPIADCKVLIAGGMGWGAYENLTSRGIETIVTDIKTIDEAVKLYLEGKLLNLQQRLH